MTDPVIIDAAARALQSSIGSTPLPRTYRNLAEIILAAVAPLIEAAALEKAARMAQNWSWTDSSPIRIQDGIAAAIRAIKVKNEVK